ncbi:plasmid partitioning protein RepB C-terminal domain-containing protein [Phyllobacterium sp. 22552]|uniref:plasmid partitioning protein RepB C-terminal domain-containing protein n=1 Tax=Phyllobacterium sp. 22552 TaxID=3453941 RepID=UPI003F874422
MHVDQIEPSWKYIDLIPIQAIRILNPRVRDRRRFNQIVENITRVGLKRPITVARTLSDVKTHQYELVCGQGRIEAFKELGQTHIPAMIIQADVNDCLLMSLVENCARRQHRSVDLLQEVTLLRKDGYSDKEIANKIGVTPEYVNMIAGLLERGEERLIAAVEAGTIPLSLAVDIAKADEEGAQAALVEAYTHKKLRGKKLVLARRLLELRSRTGGRLRGQVFGRYEAPQRPLTSEEMVRAYQREADKQKVLIKKAALTQDKLLFVVEAMRSLFADIEFVNLLKSESLDALPSQLGNRIWEGAPDGR